MIDEESKLFLIGLTNGFANRAQELVRIMVVCIALLLVFAGMVGYAVGQKELLLFCVAGVGFAFTIIWALPNPVGNERGEMLIKVICLALLVASIVSLGIVRF